MRRFSSGWSRREFLSAAGTAALAAAGGAATRVRPVSGNPQRGKRRIALVGTGVRGSSLWGKDLLDKYGDVVEMVGVCDVNPLRMAYARRHMGAECPEYSDFDRMLMETEPETVIVTTTDCFHAKYIRRAMERGCGVITEKPLATDEKMIQEILDAERRTGRDLVVTFNYRYSPEAVKVKEILLSGEIGDVTSVDFNYYLDIHHGASYFRRWHGFKQFSGSLLVHKATHHFDLMNWWLAAEPLEVHAFGDLRRYGFNGKVRGRSCRSCPHKAGCEFFWDITGDPHLMKLYVEAETADGYIRDACVFREKINIWDTMSAQVRYHDRVLLNYSLNAFMPYEGYFVGFNGTRGRFEARIYHNQPWRAAALAEFRLTRNFKSSRTFSLDSGGGGHWGADRIMQDRIFRRGAQDGLGQEAGSRDGALSALIGIAARRSIEQGRPFRIDELVKI